MTDDAALFAAALANPGDQTPRLVLADWLDEHGDEGPGRALRPTSETIPFLSALVRWDVSPVRRVWSYQGDAWVQQRDALPAATLLLRYRDQFPVPPNAPDGFEPDVEPSNDPRAPLGPAQFLAWWQSARQRQIRGLRETAARTSAGPRTPVAEFTRLTTDPETFEYRCCLLHELVLRGCDVSSIKGTDKYLTAMSRRGHPLAWLPPRLLPVESGVGRWLPYFGQGSFGGRYVHSSAPQPVADAAAGSSLAEVIVSRAEPDRDGDAWAAVRGWEEESNGTLEACELRFGRAVPVGGLTVRSFRSLGLDSLADGDDRGLQVSGITAQYALELLFSAACPGGAYGRQEWGTYGRLHAWQSLAWLAGADPGADAETVAEAAEGCRWFRYSGTDWFDDIAWDLGLVAFRPDGLSAAVLAATDTD